MSRLTWLWNMSQTEDVECWLETRDSLEAWNWQNCPLIIQSGHFFGREIHLSRCLFKFGALGYLNCVFIAKKTSVLESQQNFNTKMVQVYLLHRQNTVANSNSDMRIWIDKVGTQSDLVAGSEAVADRVLAPEVMYCTVLYCTALHCTVLYCTDCNVMHCTRTWSPLYWASRTESRWKLQNNFTNI